MISPKLVVAIGLTMLLGATARASDDITLEIMGSRTSWVDQEFTGHAFLCIALNLKSGPREDCYGFYPTGTGSIAMIAGSGGLSSEFTKNPTRFSRIEASVKRAITPEQRRTVLGLATDWNQKKFNLTNQNCIDFVDSVAAALNLKRPDRHKFQLPLDYVKQLQKLNG